MNSKLMALTVANYLVDDARQEHILAYDMHRANIDTRQPTDTSWSRLKMASWVLKSSEALRSTAIEAQGQDELEWAAARARYQRQAVCNVR